LVDLSDSNAPIAEVSAARAVAGPDLKLVVLGTVNDVGLFRDLLSAGASDYLVQPSSRDALAAVLDKRSSPIGATPDGRGQVVVFIGSRGGVGATTSAVACAWLLAAERPERIGDCITSAHRDATTWGKTISAERTEIVAVSITCFG
jgi:pilus assembly protein CpaE